MKIMVDEHLQSVLEFMQQNVPANKLVGVAEKLPEMARLLWDRYPQEPFRAVELTNGSEAFHEPQVAATE